MSLREGAEIERQIELNKSALIEFQADEPPHGGTLTLGNTPIQIVCENGAIRQLLKANLIILKKAYKECITHLYENLGDEEYEQHIHPSDETTSRTKHF